MNLLTEIRLYLEVLVWPGLVIFLVIFFRKHIEGLLKRVEECELPWKTKLKFGTESIKPLEQLNEPNARINQKERVGDIYWVSADLARAQIEVMRGGDSGVIIHCLNQSLFHLNRMELGTKNYQRKLEGLAEKLQEANESDLTPRNRQLLIKDIVSIRSQLGKYIAACQTDFKSKPEV